VGPAFLNYFTRNADNVIIGYALGPSTLGLYTKAYGLLTLPIQQINGPLSSVAIPGLSVLQNQPARFVEYYRRAVGLMVFLSIPLIVFVIVFAEPIVLLVLGAKWQASIPIFRALGPAALMGAWNVAPGWLFMSCGRTSALLRYGLVSGPITVLSFLIGVQWGAIGVAYAFSIAFCVLYICLIPYACHQTPVKPRDFVSSIWRPLFGAITAAVFALVTMCFWSAGNGIMQILVYATVFTCCYLSVIAILPGGRHMLREISALVTTLRRRGD